MSIYNNNLIKIICVIQSKLYFLVFSSDKAYIYFNQIHLNKQYYNNKNYILKKRDIKKVSSYGKSSVVLIYNNKNNQIKNIFLSFLSKTDKTIFQSTLFMKLSDNSIAPILHKKKIFKHILDNDNFFCRWMIQKFNYKLIKHSLYYTVNSIYILSNFFNEQFNHSNIDLINVLHFSLIIDMFDLFFSSFTRITNHREIALLQQREKILKREMTYLSKRRKKIHIKHKEIKTINKKPIPIPNKTNSIVLSSSKSSESTSKNEISLGENNSLIISQIPYPKTKRYKFEISINKYFCSRKINYIFFTSKGIFTISNYSNQQPQQGEAGFSVDNVQISTDLPQYSLSNTNKIDTVKFDSNRVIIHLINQNKEKILTFDFIKTIDKFVFKSLAYNFLLADLKKETLGKYLGLNVTVITWNLSNIPLPNSMISCFNKQELETVDLFVIGVQECSYWKKSEWQKHLRNLLQHYGFECIASVEMWQMFEMAFIRKNLAKFVDNVYTDSKAMGFGNMVGNKGGMVIAFKYLGYQFVFVNCHLAPKPYKVLERNKMIKNITKLIRLPNMPYVDFDVAADYMFWFGDLNYRIDYPFKETLDILIKCKGLSGIRKLLLKDQLIKQRRDNNVFYNFIEPEIIFFPTYRREKKQEKNISMETIKKNRECINQYHDYMSRSLTVDEPKALEINTNEDSLIEQDLIINTNSTREKTKTEAKIKINKINTFDLTPSTKNIFEEEKNEDSFGSSHQANSFENPNDKTLKINSTREPTDTINIDDIIEETKTWEIRQYSNKQNQSPSWCDRILLKTQRKVDVLFYSSLSDIRHSDHLPVEAKYTLSLTTPIVKNYKFFKRNQDKIGYYQFKSFSLLCNLINLFSEELEIEICFPFYIELSVYFELITSPTITKSHTIRNNKMIEKQPIKFPGINLPFHQLLLDYPHGKALNIFFVVKLVFENSKHKIDAGYGKYSLEYVELSQKLALNHDFTIDLFLHTRKMGEISFLADYSI